MKRGGHFGRRHFDRPWVGVLWGLPSLMPRYLSLPFEVAWGKRLVTFDSKRDDQFSVSLSLPFPSPLQKTPRYDVQASFLSTFTNAHVAIVTCIIFKVAVMLPSPLASEFPPCASCQSPGRVSRPATLPCSNSTLSVNSNVSIGSNAMTRSMP